MGGEKNMRNDWGIKYTIIEALGFDAYCVDGVVIDEFEAGLEEQFKYNYRFQYISKGIIVSVWEDGKLRGYLG